MLAFSRHIEYHHWSERLFGFREVAKKKSKDSRQKKRRSIEDIWFRRN